MWRRSSPGRENSQREAPEMGTCIQRTREMSLAQGPDGVWPYNHGKDFGFYSECDGEPLKGFEQSSDVISQGHADCCAGNKRKDAKVEANRELALKRLLQ